MDIDTLIREMTPDQIRFEVNRGARFVVYQYCVSLLIVTLRRNSAVQFIKADESAAAKSLPYTALTFLLGWWGIPWGFIYTPQVLYRNLKGGIDVTSSVLEGMNRSTEATPAPVLV